ncbi:MAG: hypothetical protein IJY25_02520 [Bacilli bacterium]|nr:hypothetical protein [Bacilli bacterium]
MIKYQDVKQVIMSDDFVREPVDSICKNINNTSSKKIILSGERGSGKSMVLCNNEILGLGTNNQCISISFDAVGMNVLTPNKYFNEKFMIHYYEVIMCYKILDYIKKYYGLTYERYFKDYEILLNKYLTSIDNYIEKSVYEKIFLRKYLTTGELSAEIMGKFKSCLGLNTVTLAIDRFDWTNSKISKSQETLSKYFNIFDKVVITTDDERMLDESNRTLLKEKGYSFIDVNYGKDLEVVKEIIKRRIEKHNNNSHIAFPIENMTNQIYQSLIDKTTGNITLMFRILDETNSLLRWNKYDFDISRDINMACDEKVKKEKEFKKIGKPSRLYL